MYFIYFLHIWYFWTDHGVDIRISHVRRTGPELGVVRLVETMDLDLDRSRRKYKMTSRATELSSWSSTFNPYSPLQMLIIKSLLLAVSFLTLSILAAPIPLDAGALSSDDDMLFSRATTKGGKAKSKVKPLHL